MNTTAPRIETFSSVDAAWLHMDTPTNLAVINGVMTFDRPLDKKRLEATIRSRFLSYNRFRQRVVENESQMGLPGWELDPDFDLSHHLLFDRLPDPGNHQVLQELLSKLISLPLDPSRPLWQMLYLENYGQGSALVGRLHHCIADGIALMQILLSLADDTPDAPWPTVVEPTPVSPAPVLSPLAQKLYPAVKAVKTARRNWHAAGAFLHEGMDILTTPTRLVKAASYGAKSTLALGKLLFILPDPKTVFKQKCQVEKRAAWTKAIRLDEAKAVGQKMGGTINDVLLSAMTGALRRYLEQRGEPVEGLDIRAIVPVNLRSPKEAGMLGNRFGLVFLSLPVGIVDPVKRLVVIKQRMNAIKDSPEALVAFGILGGIGLSPLEVEQLVLAIFSLKGSAVMTNVPGPTKPVYLAGEKIDTFIFWVPTPGNISMGMSIFSYNGDVIVGFQTDVSMVPDPETIITTFQEEFEFMKQWGRPAGSALSDQAPIADANGMCQALTRAGLPCKNHALPGAHHCRVHQIRL